MRQMLYEWEKINEGREKGREEGRREEREEMFNRAVNFMKSEGMTSEQIDRFKNSLSKR